MRKYELTVILPTDLKKEDSEKIVDKISKAIELGEGKIAKHTDLGKKELAYVINKVKEGNYYFWEFSSEPDKLKEIDRKVRAEEKIMRYLIVNYGD